MTAGRGRMPRTRRESRCGRGARASIGKPRYNPQCLDVRPASPGAPANRVVPCTLQPLRHSVQTQENQSTGGRPAARALRPAIRSCGSRAERPCHMFRELPSGSNRCEAEGRVRAVLPSRRCEPRTEVDWGHALDARERRAYAELVRGARPYQRSSGAAEHMRWTRSTPNRPAGRSAWNSI